MSRIEPDNTSMISVRKGDLSTTKLMDQLPGLPGIETRLVGLLHRVLEHFDVIERDNRLLIRRFRIPCGFQWRFETALVAGAHPVEFAFDQGSIDRAQMEAIVTALGKSDYGRYLRTTVLERK